jgi:hypothetical protein
MRLELVTRALFPTIVGLATSAATVAVLSTQSTPPMRADTDVPFAVGETLTYDVTWSSTLVAGSAVMTVLERASSLGSSAYRIVAEGKPLPMLESLYHLYYRMETVLDSVTLLPHLSSLYSEEGVSTQTATTTFERAARIASFEVQSEPAVKVDVPVPQQAQDGLSAVYVLRTMALRAGESFSLPITDRGRVYSMKAAVNGHEPIAVPFGQVDAWSLDITITDEQGVPAAENVAVWISDDERRLPIRLQANLPVGDFVLLLRDVK